MGTPNAVTELLPTGLHPDTDLSCEQFDGSGGIQDAGDGIEILTGNYTCGANAVAGAILLYDNTTGTGVIIEGQRDNWPDPAADEALLLQIAESVTWG